MPYAAKPHLSIGALLARGLRRRCPNCGEGRAFKGYLSIADNCAACGEPLGHIHADDFPPYLTIFVVGHIVVPLVLFSEQNWAWPTELHMAIWLPLTLALTLTVLPLMKGAALALMWRLGLTGDEHQ